MGPHDVNGQLTAEVVRHVGAARVPQVARSPATESPAGTPTMAAVTGDGFSCKVHSYHV
jgi:hypothetical protein